MPAKAPPSAPAGQGLLAATAAARALVQVVCPGGPPGEGKATSKSSARTGTPRRPPTATREGLVLPHEQSRSTTKQSTKEQTRTS